jgi:hypothetical protein
MIGEAEKRRAVQFSLQRWRTEFWLGVSASALAGFLTGAITAAAWIRFSQ